MHSVPRVSDEYGLWTSESECWERVGEFLWCKWVNESEYINSKSVYSCESVIESSG